MTVRSRTLRVLAAAVLAAGAATSASILLAGNASADWCYSADCVPNVARNVIQGAPCMPQPRRAFAYGLEPDGATVVCDPTGVWAAAGPLVGVYNVSQRCPALNLSAQGSDGIALMCGAMAPGSLRWVHR